LRRTPLIERNPVLFWKAVWRSSAPRSSFSCCCTPKQRGHSVGRLLSLPGPQSRRAASAIVSKTRCAVSRVRLMKQMCFVESGVIEVASTRWSAFRAAGAARLNLRLH